MDIKNIFKSIALYLSGAVLVLVLFMLAYSLVFATVTANPDKIKQLLDDSGIYENITPVFYDEIARPQATPEGQSTGPAELPLQDAAVKDAALKAFSPDYIKTSVESIIDGTYKWLDGQTPQPVFSVDLAGPKNQLAQEIAAQAGARIETLPVCTPQQQRDLQETSLLSYTCRPRNVNIEALKAEFIDSINNEEDFLKETTLTPDTLKDENGKSVFDNYNELPKTFRLGKKMPFVLGVIALILSAVVVALSATRREGAKRLAKLFLVVGLLAILFPLGINTLIDGLVAEPTADAATTQILIPVLNQFMDAAAKVYYITGGVYLVIAAAAFVIYQKFLTPPTAKPTGKTADGTNA